MTQHSVFQITQKLFLRKGQKLLVLRDRKSGLGDLPGGRMTEKEFFSDWKESLKRELVEELGSSFSIKIHDDIILVHRHRVNADNHPCIILGYEGEFLSGEPVMSDEHDFMEWVDINTYNPENLFSEYMLEAVNIYLRRNRT
ncbi:MAG TPA: NUDIX hydrolase [Leptospiraceae bacterium]|nr:NUDIX hydrolase [Leptospiraceae bacterium]HMY65585.1 NUDIX hydrolase [Leptospiraceae bacterium]HMZ61511.1 NUDIX hydrolase [Leptospiraceae bacterium]HNF14924.1 NUDIX hydrolase [Leptospiraceae bacterium]HNI94469.1 NUDIX hydrolase [Leptospiraceae bacterium]